MLRRARERRVLRSLGRWTQANSPSVGTAVARTVIVKSLGPPITPWDLKGTRMPRLTLVLIAALALMLAACSADDEAGTPGDSVRTVTATLSDDMAIQLSESDFAVGDTVRFEVTNSGASPHEFYLGDAEAQEHHAEEMADMDGEEMHDEEDGIAVEPGATETLEYTFERAGEILAGCHEPGHYEAGMVASMTIADD